MATRYVDPSLSGAAGDGTIGDPWSFLSTVANASSGDVCLVKAGTSTFATFNTADLIWIGCDANYAIATVPTVTIDLAGAASSVSVTAAHNWFRNFRFTNNSGANDLVSLGTGAHNTLFYRCRMDTAGRSTIASTTADGLTLIASEVNGWGSGGYGLSVTSGISHYVYGTVFRDASSSAVRTTSTSGFPVSRCLFDTVAGSAYEIGSSTLDRRAASFVNNTVYACTNGIEWRSSSSIPMLVANNIFQGVTGTAILNGSSQTVWMLDYNNRFFGNGTDKSGSFYGHTEVFSGILGRPMEDAANGDYRILANDLGHNAGIPATWLINGGLTSDELGIDVGAWERQISSTIRPRHKIMESIVKNTASQKLYVWAVSALTGEKLPSSAANITCKVSIDGAAPAALNDVNPTEIGDGLYAFDLTQAETNGNRLLFTPESSVTNTLLDAIEHCTIVQGATNTYVSPGSAVAPSIATLSATNIECYQDSESPDILLGIEDEAGDPIDLSAATIRFVVWENDDPGEIYFEVDTADGITVADTNQVTIPLDLVDTSAAGSWAYNLWDVGAKRVLSAGQFKVIETALGGA